MNTTVKTIFLTIIISTFCISANSQTCHPKPIVFPAKSKTVTVKGNIKKCPEYFLQIKKNQRLQIKLTANDPDVYFALEDLAAEEESDPISFEDSKEIDEFFDFSANWKIFVYGAEAVENSSIDYTLTITLTDSQVFKGGVLNGKAISLPKPPFPKEAREKGASGTVTVEVTVDENGKVVTAEAVSGNELFYYSAEEAAVKARFSPTIVNGKPVRVEGVIVYNFKP
ncbi:MAG TPA: energy transducer TonB [Pyrinomonadaceae bacterium]|nr:energy transducer TonB [Pyrinomonadaceae bacterium]